jgi:hypothetical protein
LLRQLQRLRFLAIRQLGRLADLRSRPGATPQGGASCYLARYNAGEIRGRAMDGNAAAQLAPVKWDLRVGARSVSVSVTATLEHPEASIWHRRQGDEARQRFLERQIENLVREFLAEYSPRENHPTG